MVWLYAYPLARYWPVSALRARALPFIRQISWHETSYLWEEWGEVGRKYDPDFNLKLYNCSPLSLRENSKSLDLGCLLSFIAPATLPWVSACCTESKHTSPQPCHALFCALNLILPFFLLTFPIWCQTPLKCHFLYLCKVELNAPFLVLSLHILLI